MIADIKKGDIHYGRESSARQVSKSSPGNPVANEREIKEINESQDQIAHFSGIMIANVLFSGIYGFLGAIRQEAVWARP